MKNNFNDHLWKFDFNWQYMYRNMLVFIVSFLKKVKTFLKFLRQKIYFKTFYQIAFADNNLIIFLNDRLKSVDSKLHS